MVMSGQRSHRTERKLNMQTLNATDNQLHLIQEESGQTEEIRIEYSLYEIGIAHGNYYAVHIRTSNESDMRILGSDFKRAQRLFEILVNETVTPCTLRYILYEAETMEEDRNHEQNLYKN